MNLNEPRQLAAATLDWMVKDTFGEHFAVTIVDQGNGVFNFTISTLMLSAQPLLEETLSLPRDELAMRLNDKMADGLQELADLMLKTSNDIRSKLL